VGLREEAFDDVVGCRSGGGVEGVGRGLLGHYIVLSQFVRFNVADFQEVEHLGFFDLELGCAHVDLLSGRVLVVLSLCR